MPGHYIPSELLLMIIETMNDRHSTVIMGLASKRMGTICRVVLFRNISVDVEPMNNRRLEEAIEMLSKEYIRHLIKTITIKGWPVLYPGLAKRLRNIVVDLPMLLSLTLEDTAHRFQDNNILSLMLKKFVYRDNWFNRSSSDELVKFIKRCPELLEIHISTSSAEKVSQTVNDIPDSLDNLESLHAPWEVCDAIVPRAGNLKRLSINRTSINRTSTWCLDNGVEHLIKGEMWKNLTVLLISNIHVTSDFMLSVAKNGGALEYLELELDTTTDSWRSPFYEVLKLNLRGMGVKIVADQDWTAGTDFTFSMLEKAELIRSLIERTGLLKMWIQVLGSTTAWSRTDENEEWVREEGWVATWFWSEE
ncbi:hypothetical protein FRC02_010869 [Tulasnella sp. 418]|nr:hypothetical protein FRC02_010869 [Tulasnella sp. 418]